jgi:ABC-type bacteriocin/lantibiotic exporter with double-glycine peptidase domain
MFKLRQTYPGTTALLWQAVRNYRYYFVLLVVTILVVTLINVRIPFFLGKFSELVIAGTSFTQYGIFLVVIYLVKLLFQWLLTYQTRTVSETISLSMKEAMIAKVVEVDFASLEQVKSGDMVQKVFQELGMVQGKLLFGSIYFIKDVIFATLLFVGIALATWKIAALLLGIAVLMYLFNWGFSLRIQRNNRQIQTLNARMLGYFVEVMHGKKDVYIYDLGPQVLSKFKGIMGGLRGEFRRAGLNDAATVLFMEGVFMLAGIGVMAILWMDQKSMSESIVVITSLSMLLWPLREAYQYYISLNAIYPSMERIEQMLDTLAPSHTASAQSAYEVRPAAATALHLQSVSFAFSPERPLIQDCNLRFEPGLTLVYGANGAGKSTLLELIMGLRPPQSGRVILESPRPTQPYREQVKLVRQEVFLFDDSVWENLRVVSPDLTTAQLSSRMTEGIAAVLMRLPQGLDTRVGERSGQLSGGERQLVNLCRGLLMEPEVLLLDEITNNLAQDLIHPLLREIKRRRAGKVTILVSHHPLEPELFDATLQL